MLPLELSNLLLQLVLPLDSEMIWIALGTIFAGAAVIITVVTLFLTRRNERKLRKQELYQKYTAQVTELLKEELRLKSKGDCEWYAVAYLDLIDSMARLYNMKIIDVEVVKYFKFYFMYGIRILKWIPKNDDAWFAFAQEPEKVWFDLVKLCDKMGYKAVEDLPNAMKNWKDLPDYT